jgi:hypothetical protein
MQERQDTDPVSPLAAKYFVSDFFKNFDTMIAEILIDYVKVVSWQEMAPGIRADYSPTDLHEILTNSVVHTTNQIPCLAEIIKTEIVLVITVLLARRFAEHPGPAGWAALSARRQFHVLKETLPADPVTAP